ncbi:MAG: aldo/keto reductase [Patescibacteria group bacterium]|nr:aldo/keto reductase [Patescibacteria group bacterium]
MITLGSTGLDVFEIGLGTVELGIPSYGVKLPSEKAKTEKEAVKFLHSALEMGVNFYDTAALYGSSEDIIGKAFADRRDKAVIATKCVHLEDSWFETSGEIYSNFMKSIKNSLKRLSTDYVDVLQLHSSNEKILSHEEVIKFFEDAKKEGLIRFSGASVYGADDAKLAVSAPHMDLVQLAYNVFDRRMDDEVLPMAASLGKGVIIRSILLRGALTPRIEHFNKSSELAVRERVLSLADKLSCSLEDLPAICTSFVLTKRHGVALIGAGNESELKTALCSIDLSLSDKELEILDSYRTDNLQIIEPFRWD